jgi:PAS domain S-box-containing protein
MTNGEPHTAPSSSPQMSEPGPGGSTISPRDRIRRSVHQLLILVALLVCAAVLIGFVSLRSLESRLVADAGESLAFTADEVAGQLSALLLERSSDVRLLAHALKTIPKDRISLRRYMESVGEEFRTCCWIGVTNDVGIIIASSALADIGANRIATEWFQSVRDLPYLSVQEIEEPKPDGMVTHGISISAPIWSLQGRFVGAVSLHIGFPEIERTFARTIRTLERQRGLVGKIDWIVLTAKGDILDESRRLPSGRLNLKQAGLPSALAVMSDWSGYVEEIHIRRQVPVVTGYANVRRFDGSTLPDWRVLVRIDRRDVIAPIRDLLWQLGAAMAVIVVPVVGFLLWTIHRLRQEWETAVMREERLEATFSGIGDAVVVIDEQGHIVTLNGVAEHLTGWTASDAKGKALTDVVALVDEQDRLRTEPPISPPSRAGQGWGKAHRALLLARDGAERPVEACIVPLGDAIGSARGSVLVFRDISERRRAELEQAQLAAIVESSDDAIIGKRLDGTITGWNRGAERLYGYSAEEMKGQSITRIFPPWLRDEFAHIQNRLTRGERIDHYETTRIRKDGKAIPVSITVSPIKNAEGRIVGASAIARDLSVRKRDQQELPASLGA